MTTSPFHWKLIIDGIQYDEGRETETRIVYPVKGIHPRTAEV